jgi:hypothetical protein
VYIDQTWSKNIDPEWWIQQKHCPKNNLKIFVDQTTYQTKAHLQKCPYRGACPLFGTRGQTYGILPSNTSQPIHRILLRSLTSPLRKNISNHKLKLISGLAMLRKWEPNKERCIWDLNFPSSKQYHFRKQYLKEGTHSIYPGHSWIDKKTIWME